jgi:D-inositol-3-phosphate glycosyltransferase
VAASVGGLRHVVAHGESGFLVDGEDPGRYAEAIAPVLADPDLAGRLSAGGVRRATAFTWERTVDALLGVYGELRPRLLADPAPDRAPA